VLLAALLSFLSSRLTRESESKRGDADRRLRAPRVTTLVPLVSSRLTRESESKRRDANRRLSPPRVTVLVSMLTDLLCLYVCSFCLYLRHHPCSLSLSCAYACDYAYALSLFTLLNCCEYGCAYAGVHVVSMLTT